MILVLLSILLTLGFVDFSLRLFYPKYVAAAEAQLQSDSLRITTRTPNTHRYLNHPDNGESHHVICNNHGMLQHRDFL